MLQSHIVEVGGTFVGAAITTTTGLRFRAVHAKVEDLDESTWRSLDELSQAVAALFNTGRLGTARPTAIDTPLQSAATSLLLASTKGAAAWMG